MSLYNSFRKKVATAVFAGFGLIGSSYNSYAEEPISDVPIVMPMPRNYDEAMKQTLDDLVIDTDETIDPSFESLKDRKLLHATTPHYDITTSLNKTELEKYAKTSEKARSTLEYMMGISPDKPLSLKQTRIFICPATEYKTVLEKLGVNDNDIKTALSISSFISGNKVLYATQPKNGEIAERDKYVQLITAGLLSRNSEFSVPSRGTYLHPWLTDAITVNISAIVNQSTLAYTQGSDNYGKARKFETKENMYQGTMFNPKYMSAMLKAGKEMGFRYLMGLKDYAPLAADTAVEGYFRIKWLSEVKDAEHKKFGQALKLEVDGEEPEIAFRKAFEVPENKPAYETLDNEFREYHLKTYPVADERKPSKSGKHGRK